MSAGNSRLLYKPPQVPPQEALQILTTARLKPPPHLPVSADQLKRSCTSHAMSATKCLVSLMVVLVAAVCVAHAQERIKMCGRELIRLAVSSCGNSRLRRSILDLDVDQHQYTAHCEYCQTLSVAVTPVSHISDYCLISYRTSTTPELSPAVRLMIASLNSEVFQQKVAHFQGLVLTPDVSPLLRGPGCLHGGAPHCRD